MGPQYDYFGDGQQPIYRQQAVNFGNSFGGGNNLLNNGDNTVNFDFLCKCQAKSSLIKSSTPSSGDLSTQQQVQQLQEQVKKLQEQINKSQQGKSSFEQFAQMLSLADGLDCNCSGHSTPWTGWPSTSLINGGNNIEMPNINPYNIPHQIIPPTNNNRVINPLSIAGNGQFIPMGGFCPNNYNDLIWLSKRIISIAGIKNDFPQIGIICGSGLNNLADRIKKPIIIPFDKLPGFPLPSVIGHKGNVIFGWLGGKYCICLQGRFHPYEHNMDMSLVCWTENFDYYQDLALISTEGVILIFKCTMPVRLMALMGVRTLIASNAAGGVNPDLNIGDLMILKDHIFMPGLIGQKAFILAKNFGISIKEGVYLMNAGPHYETMAEVSLAAKLGADAVGMSTCHEVMVARQLGLRCFAFSLITNCSSLDLDNPMDISHSDVLEIGRKISERASEWIAQLIDNLDNDL
uniref:purine-nucleoside phosphorylase n=1 Tax=Meloidogyne javanica TaxID=6303 RepID=A0A915MYC8_MELJA